MGFSTSDQAKSSRGIGRPQQMRVPQNLSRPFRKASEQEFRKRLEWKRFWPSLIFGKPIDIRFHLAVPDRVTEITIRVRRFSWLSKNTHIAPVDQKWNRLAESRIYVRGELLHSNRCHDSIQKNDGRSRITKSALFDTINVLSLFSLFRS